MKETRFERSENRVRVRQNLVNHLETLSFLFSRIFAGMKTKSGQCTIEVLLQPGFRLFRLSTLQWRQNLVNEVPLLAPFLPFFACLHCNEDRIWAMHYSSLTTAWFSAFSRVFTAMKTKSGQCTIEVLLQPIFGLFLVSSLQWRQNLVNAPSYYPELNRIWPRFATQRPELNRNWPDLISPWLRETGTKPETGSDRIWSLLNSERPELSQRWSDLTSPQHRGTKPVLKETWISHFMVRFPFCSTRISKVGKCIAFQLWTPTYFFKQYEDS